MIRFAVALVLIMLAISAVAERVAISVGAQESGEILIVRIVCEGEGNPVLLQVGSSAEAAKPPDGCVEDKEALPKGQFFIVAPSSDTLESSLFTDAETGEASTSLPAGEYEIIAGDSGAIVLVESGSTTYVQSVWYAERPTVDLCAVMGVAQAGGPDPLVENGPRLRWELPISGTTAVLSVMAINDDTVAVALGSGRSSALAGFDVASGQTSWCNEFVSNFGTPPVAMGGVIVATIGEVSSVDPGETIAFDGASGGELWRHTPGLVNLSRGSSSDGIVTGSSVHFDEPRVELVAIDLSTGHERWRYAPQERWGPGSTVVADGSVYVPVHFAEGLPTPAVFAIDASTGDERWRIDFGAGGSIRGATYANGVLYLGMQLSASCCVVAVDGETGAELWRSDAVATEFSNPLVVDGVIYVGGTPGFVALGSETGAVLWHADLGGIDNPVQSTPILLNGQVVVADPLGSGAAGEPDLVGLNAISGSELWRIPLGRQGDAPSPVVSGGVVVIAGASLLALELHE